MSLEKMGQAAREAAYQLATVSTAQKNRALAAIADELEARSEQILAANAKISPPVVRRACQRRCWIACCLIRPGWPVSWRMCAR